MHSWGDTGGEAYQEVCGGIILYRSCLFLLVVLIVFTKQAYSRENIYFHFFSISELEKVWVLNKVT